MTAPTLAVPRERRWQTRTQAVDDYDVALITFLAAGYTTQQIGRILHRSRSGVQSHLSKMYRRMGVNNGPHAVATALRAGWIR